MIVGLLKGLFSSGVVGSVERIASEAIQTDKETAEAKSLWIKTLDPNGLMRRELSRFSCKAYGYYLLVTSILAIVHAFGLGDVEGSKAAMNAMTDLFMPITGAWATIIGASFGVNATNSFKGK